MGSGRAQLTELFQPSAWVLGAEYAGLGFWIASLLLVRRPPSWLVVVWHLVALALSFAAPALLVLDGGRAPARAVAMLSVLGVLNGVLASAWCGRIDPAVSKMPMLGITVAGFVSALFLVLTAASPARLF